MTEKFEVIFYGDVINCVRDETGKEYNLHELINLLMDQQATIERLVRKLKKYAKIGEEQLKQIIELQEENEQLKNRLNKGL